MRKLFLLFALVAMCSCKPMPATIEERNDPQMCDFDRIRHFVYKGHKYISFEQNPGHQYATLGIVHDPNCPCHGK